MAIKHGGVGSRDVAGLTAERRLFDLKPLFAC